MLSQSTTSRPEPRQAVSVVSHHPPPPSARLQSLDVLRGLAIALMILVNTSGDGVHTYRELVHAPWNGLTFADVVFPCFLFILGTSLVLSLRGRLARGVARPRLIRQALQRAIILFLIGVALNGFPWYHLATLRIYGVLQRIAFCYFVAMLMYLWLKPKSLLLIVVAILLGYYILLRWVPVPGYGMPGTQVAFLDPYGNLPAWLDRHVFPASHLYGLGFYDPEGLLSSLPALASTLLGVLTGVALAREKSIRASWLLLAGVSLLIAGLLWSNWFPLNKRLWTSSFVLANAGISLLTLALLHAWLDGRHNATRVVYPFLVLGSNSLAAYILSEFLSLFLASVNMPHAGITWKQWLFHPLAVLVPDGYVASLVYSVLYVGVCFLPIWLLYRERLFLKV